MAAPQQSPKAPRTRRMVICNKYFSRIKALSGFVTFPIISLSGKWLQDSGFRSGQTIDITCEDGRLTITLAKEQRYSQRKKRA